MQRRHGRGARRVCANSTKFVSRLHGGAHAADGRARQTTRNLGVLGCVVLASSGGFG